MRQIAALPYTTHADGSMQILLITSRDTRRWVIPKGNRIKGLAGHRAAELEAFEEAGIHGIACLGFGPSLSLRLGLSRLQRALHSMWHCWKFCCKFLNRFKKSTLNAL